MTPFFDIEVTKAEYKTRKQWLISTLIMQGFAPLLLLLGLPFPLEQKEIVMLLGPLLSLWILYHCAYRNCGIKWLTLVLILSPLGILRALNEIPSHNFSTICFDTIQIALYIWWYILSLRLRKLNKKILEHKKNLQVTKPASS